MVSKDAEVKRSDVIKRSRSKKKRCYQKKLKLKEAMLSKEAEVKRSDGIKRSRSKKKRWYQKKLKLKEALTRQPRKSSY